jgi:hypothetical protein
MAEQEKPTCTLAAGIKYIQSKQPPVAHGRASVRDPNPLTTVDLIRLRIDSRIRHNMTLWAFYLTSQCISTRENFDVT